MASIRSELEIRLANFAAAQTPPIPVSWEGVPFVAPTSGPYIQAMMLGSTNMCPTVDGTRVRVRGNFQINVVVHDGTGSKAVEDLTDAIVALYPILPKTGKVSIESPPQTGAAILIVDKRYIPITVSYRVEQ
jgi:Bacteriophage related domain of unknown function